MNRFRQLCATTLLTMLLAASTVLAGNLPQGVIAPPPAETSVTGNLPQGLTSAIDPVTEFTLSLLQSLLSLF